MTDRTYRLVSGILILAFLYFDIKTGLVALICVQALEGLTNWRVPILLTKVRGQSEQKNNVGNAAEAVMDTGIPFDAERALRLTMAGMLALSVVVFPEPLWFLPWFMGFAILGAGLSGVCPMLVTLKFMGFR